jgi:ribose 5-phosphate isomerase B
VEIRKIAIGNDHGGYELKVRIAEHLRGKGLEVVDVGTDSTEIVRYPYFAAKVVNMVASGQAPRGILICSTGIGMSIMANKHRGIRAALCTSTYMARLTREHNDSNILCLGGKITGEFEAIDMVDTWLAAEYQGGRHDISLGIIAEAEEILCTCNDWVPAGPMK